MAVSSLNFLSLNPSDSIETGLSGIISREHTFDLKTGWAWTFCSSFFNAVNSTLIKMYANWW